MMHMSIHRERFPYQTTSGKWVFFFYVFHLRDGGYYWLGAQTLGLDGVP